MAKKNSKTGRPLYSGGEAKPGRIGKRLKGQAAKGPRDISYFKPPRFKDHLTLSEMAAFVPCDPSWLRHLERQGRIPRAARVQRGQLQVRLWSPEQANEIQRIIESHKVGRPSND